MGPTGLRSGEYHMGPAEERARFGAQRQVRLSAQSRMGRSFDGVGTWERDHALDRLRRQVSQRPVENG